MVTALSCQINIETRFKSYQFKTKQQSKNTKRGKLHGTARFQMGTTGLHVQQHYWLCCDVSNVHDMRSQLYTQLKLKSTGLFRRENLLKKQIKSVPIAPLEFQLHPSNLKLVGMSKYSGARAK